VKSALLTSKTAHKPPTPIVSDDEVEDSEPLKSNNQSDNTSSSEEGQSDKKEFDDRVGGLQGLDNGLLVLALHSEANNFLLHCFLLTVVSLVCSFVFKTS